MNLASNRFFVTSEQKFRFFGRLNQSVGREGKDYMSVYAWTCEQAREILEEEVRRLNTGQNRMFHGAPVQLLDVFKA